jgi:hypothetical protein
VIWLHYPLPPAGWETISFAGLYIVQVPWTEGVPGDRDAVVDLEIGSESLAKTYVRKYLVEVFNPSYLLSVT